MNIAAYCRASTDKEDQLNSLEAQKEFFSEYTKRTGDNLVRLYVDMYADDLITRQELNDKIGGSRREVERLENELKMVSYHLTKVSSWKVRCITHLRKFPILRMSEK